MKGMEIDTRKWSDEQIQQAFAKLEAIGYVKDKEQGTKDFNGKSSITVYPDGTYCGFDCHGLNVFPDDLTPTFEELMALTKEDVA